MNETNRNLLSRRGFLKVSALGVGAVSLAPWKTRLIEDFPDAERLARVTGGTFNEVTINVRSKPDYDSPATGQVSADVVLPWLREVVGYRPGRKNQRYVETPQGYIWAPYLQPVGYHPNQPVEEIPSVGDRKGMWVEVTVPWVDAVLANPPAYHQWLKARIKYNRPVRFYYTQTFWVDDKKTDEEGNVYYRVNEEEFGGYDKFWVRAEAFRPIQAEEVSPIRPETEDKKIVVDVRYNKQYLSCFEGNTEVYFCQISSGKKDGSTPVSAYGYPIWRKLISLHMEGGTVRDGWDLPGIGWTSLFVGNGVAIHSTFWHNNFGEPMSHGCVNARPEDAKWILRWSHPRVPFPEGDVDASGEGGTKVIVKDW